MLILLSLLLAAAPLPRAAPCTVQATRYASASLPGLVTFDVLLQGPCKGVSVKVQFASNIGGIYPPKPIVLDAKHRRYLHPGNPDWWYPVKITPNGPVRIATRRVNEE